MTQPAPGRTPDPAACLAELAATLPPAALLGPGEDLARYETGARYGDGRAAFVLRPGSTDEVSRALRTCARHGVGLIPQGANTGLVGASTPDAGGGQAVLSLDRMARRIEVNRGNRSVAADAGVRLSALNAALAAEGLWFPIDLGADPALGGMVATNTGGTRCLRYGDVRRNLLGLEAVLWDGTVLDLGRSLRKNNTGLDLRQLFVGTAGRFGIVTGVVLEAQPLPAATTAALVVPADAARTLDILIALEDAFGPQLTAFEGLSAEAVTMALGEARGLRAPFPGAAPPPYMLLVEVSSWARTETGGAELRDRLDRAMETLFEDGLVVDAVLHDEGAFWAIRHHVSDSLNAYGRVIAMDLALPRDRFVAFREEARATVRAMAPEVIVADFGHVGDGATHFNMVWPTALAYDAGAAEALRLAVCDLAVAAGGSFSAEHGIGPFNRHLRDRYLPEAVLGLEERLVSAAAGRS